MKNLVVRSFLLIIICVSIKSAETVKNPPEILFEQFSLIDSFAMLVPQNLDTSTGNQDLLFKEMCYSNTLVYGMSLIDDNGTVLADFNRTGRAVSINKKLGSSPWFTIPKVSRTPFFGGVVRAHSKLCFLKSYPVVFTKNEQKSNGIIVILIDVALFLEMIEQKTELPFSVSYKTNHLYSSYITDLNLPLQTNLPGFDGLNISYSTNIDPETVDGSYPPVIQSDKKSSQTVTTILYSAIIVLTCMASFIGGRYYRRKKDYHKFVELEYERISKEQQKQIHDRALSQVYCEIKRQIETHELKKIEEDIRHKIESEIHDKIVAS